MSWSFDVGDSNLPPKTFVGNVPFACLSFSVMRMEALFYVQFSTIETIPTERVTTVFHSPGDSNLLPLPSPPCLADTPPISVA